MEQTLHKYSNIFGENFVMIWSCCGNKWELIFRSEWFPICPDCGSKGKPWRLR